LGSPPQSAFGQNKGSEATAADQPVKRTDSNSKLAHEQVVANLKKGRIDVYFVGDSITRRWRATDYPRFLANWKENFFGWNAANFGWGGDTVQNILWRLQNGELEGVHPKVIVLLAGTNNLGNTPASDVKVADITKGIKALLDTLRAKAPEATIILMGILPRNDGAKPTAVVPSIRKVNAHVAKFADGKSIRYLDINDKLADKNGKLLEGMTEDRLHLSVKGYQVWADALKPVFTELLGPPAKEDHAPPPTGDPSAAKKKARASSKRPFHEVHYETGNRLRRASKRLDADSARVRAGASGSETSRICFAGGFGRPESHVSHPCPKRQGRQVVQQRHPPHGHERDSRHGTGGGHEEGRQRHLGDDNRSRCSRRVPL
jgi:lysophospholipase L1-like esterase